MRKTSADQSPQPDVPGLYSPVRANDGFFLRVVRPMQAENLEANENIGLAPETRENNNEEGEEREEKEEREEEEEETNKTDPKHAPVVDFGSYGCLRPCCWPQ